MREVCANCWYWEFYQRDDANDRYGRCGLAYQGADEAYPSTRMLLVMEGPQHAKRLISPLLLTHESFSCADWEEQTSSS